MNASRFFCKVILLLSSVSFWLVGCDRLIYDDHDAMGCDRDIKHSIQVVATVSNYGLPAANSNGTRAAVEGSVKETESKPFDPNVEEDYAIERRVDYVMLYVYQEGKLLETRFYYDPARGEDWIPQSFKELKVAKLGHDGDKLTFDLELFSGVYSFLLLVNDQPSLAAAKEGRIRDPRLTIDNYSNGLMMGKDLGGERSTTKEPKLMPMVGQQKIEVPKATGERQTLAPVISLERVMAKVGLFITTADEGKTRYLNQGMRHVTTDGRVSGRATIDPLVDFVDDQVRTSTYSVLPFDGEYTASIGEMPLKSWIIYGTQPEWQKNITSYRAKANTAQHIALDINNSYLGEQSQQSGGYHIAKLYQHIPTYHSEGEEVPNFIYTLPMNVKGAEEKDMPYLYLGINQTGKADPNGKEMIYYRISIYTLIKAAQGTSDKEFSLRRNTYYRINARLLGTKLELVTKDGVWVLPWRKVDQEIEIDPYNPDQHSTNP